MREFPFSELTTVKWSINLAQLAAASGALVAAFAFGCTRSQAPSPSLDPSARTLPAPAEARGVSSASPPPSAAVPSARTSESPAEARGVSSASPPPSAAVARAVIATTRDACAACKGEWARHGVAEAPSCNCRTKDKGKICRDGRDCSGECIVDPALFEVVDQGPPVRGHFRGRCSEFVTAFGCNALLSDGVRDQPPVPEGSGAGGAVRGLSGVDPTGRRGSRCRARTRRAAA